MNDAAKALATQLAQRDSDSIECRNELVRMRNMACLCHCSAEIDTGTLLYFSVNDFYLGQGIFILLLFSEISPNSADQQEGRDVFGRMYTYKIIEKVVKEVFTGHYSFYSSELDGRLVTLLNFPYGLLPDDSIIRYLDVACRETSEKCRERYGMNVVTYISEPIDSPRFIASVYIKLLENASLHRYTAHRFSDAVFHVEVPVPNRTARFPSLRESVLSLVRCLINGGDYHAEADKALAGFAENQSANIDGLKRLFGDYFELICDTCTQMGIRVKTDELRIEQFQMLMRSVHWSEPVQWLHSFLDTIDREHTDAVHIAARRQLDAALRYIGENLRDPSLTIEKCAAAVDCSPSSLSKLFRRHMNTSVAKYIRDARLDTALGFIREGRPVKDTWERCGFGSSEAFHRAFKNKYGMPPGQFRGLGTAGT